MCHRDSYKTVCEAREDKTRKIQTQMEIGTIIATHNPEKVRKLVPERHIDILITTESL